MPAHLNRIANHPDYPERFRGLEDILAELAGPLILKPDDAEDVGAALRLAVEYLDRQAEEYRFLGSVATRLDSLPARLLKA